MSQFRDLIARMAVDPEFARHTRANPDDVARQYGLTPEETEQLRGLADASASAGPTALGARLSKSGIGTGGLAGVLASPGLVLDLPADTPLEPPHVPFPPLHDLNIPPIDPDPDPPPPPPFPPLHLPPFPGVLDVPDLPDFPDPLPEPPEPPGPLPEPPTPADPPTPVDPPAPVDPPSPPVEPSDPPSPPPIPPADPTPVTSPTDVAGAGDGTGAGDGKGAGDGVQSGDAGAPDAATAQPAPDLALASSDGIGVDELLIGGAGLAAGAIAGGVAGAVAGKVLGNKPNEDEDTILGGFKPA